MSPTTTWLRVFRRRKRKSHDKERLQLDDEPSTDMDVTSTSSKEYPTLPSWRVENFLVQQLEPDDWWLYNETNRHQAAMFLNRGEELWSCTRQAWLRNMSSNVVRAAPLSLKKTEMLVQFIKEKQGAHPLPKRLPLSFMVHVYNEYFWDESERNDDDPTDESDLNGA